MDHPPTHAVASAARIVIGTGPGLPGGAPAASAPATTDADPHSG